MPLSSENATAKGQMCFKGAVVDPSTALTSRWLPWCLVVWGFTAATAVVSFENYFLIGARSS